MAFPLLPSRRRFRWLRWLSVTAVLGLPARADRHVAVKATAKEDYVQQRLDENGKPRVEKYVFLEGKFAPGAIRDNSLEKTEITAIAQALAPYLARKDFLPTTDPAQADIVIAVHWGMTVSLRQNSDYVTHLMEQARERQLEARDLYQGTYYDENGVETQGSDFAQQLLQDAAKAEAAAPDYDWARMASARTESDISEQPTATLLGFADVLNQDSQRAFTGEEARTVRSLLDDERYYIVLAAYDLKTKENGQPLQRLWVARLSIPANGTNFREALQRLGEAGSDYFGENHPDLSIKRVPAKTQKAEVQVGDPIVIEATDH